MCIRRHSAPSSCPSSHLGPALGNSANLSTGHLTLVYGKDGVGDSILLGGHSALPQGSLAGRWTQGCSGASEPGVQIHRGEAPGLRASVPEWQRENRPPTIMLCPSSPPGRGGMGALTPPTQSPQDPHPGGPLGRAGRDPTPSSCSWAAGRTASEH